MIAKTIRRLPELVFIIWIITFAWLLISGYYVKYLRPDFHFLVIMGCILSFLTLLGGVLFKREKMDLYLIINNSFFILIPIVFYVISNEAYLDSFAFSKKSTQLSVDRRLNDSTNQQAKPVQDKNKLIKLSLSKLANPYYDFNGALVETEGQIFKNEKDIILYRFIVSCCAADARPIGVYLRDADLTRTLKKDEWVRVKGRFYNDQKIDNKKVKIIKPESILKIKPPPANRRYLYY